MGLLQKDIWHREVLTITKRNAVRPRRWGMRVTVTDDSTSANNTTWVLVKGLSDTNRYNNSNWQTEANYIGAGGSSSFSNEAFAANGVLTQFVVSTSGATIYMVEVGGQVMRPTTDYSVVAQTITFGTAPANGTTVVAYFFSAASASGGSGTVVSVASADANATVANPTTTPVITIVSAPKFLTARTISASGDITYTSPAFDGSANVSANATVTKINGTALSALATGLLKNTTTTGVPSIAVAGTDYLAPGGALGTPSSGTATNLTGTAAGLTAGNANAAPASGITGTTLASNVVASSIATLGADASLPGNPTTTTQSPGNNSTRIATTSFVTTAVANTGTGELSRYIVTNYGAIGDGVKLTDGAITNGSATFTSATAAFTSDAVGKSIRVAGAGPAGADLLTTISAFTNSTTVTLAASASTTVSGATFYWGTDCTAGIQAAIQAVVTANGVGTVFFPFTGKFYYLFAALVTSVDGINPNCQIYIPKTLIPTNQVLVKLLGEVSSNLVYGGNATFEYNSGVIIESHILGSGTAPAVFGCSFNTSGGGGTTNFTHTSVIVENLVCKVRSKTGTTHIAPSMSAFDMSKAIAFSGYNSVACTQSGLANQSVLPTDVTVSGFRFPGRLNTAILNGSSVNLAAFGFYTGFNLYDHMHISNLTVAAVVDGIALEISDQLGNNIEKYFCDGAIHAWNFVGVNSIICNYFSLEDNGVGHWYANVNPFYSASTPDIRGVINYDLAITPYSATTLGGTLALIDINDFRGGALLDDFASSSGFASFGIHNIPSKILATTGSNFATLFTVGPRGTGGSSTSKAYFTTANTDNYPSNSNFEILQRQALGSNGYTDNIRKNGSGSLRAYNFQMDDANVFGVDTSGRFTLTRTITAAGTTGNQTINKLSGTANIAAAGSSVTITNSKVDANSLVYAWLRTNDATATGVKSVVCSSGSFVVTLTAATTAEVSIGFIVIN